MRVCLIGDFSKDLDEGYKNVSHYLAQELETRVDLSTLDVKKILNAAFWKRFVNHRPQIAHLIAQPTLSSLLFIVLCKICWKDVRIVISALRPERFFAARMFLIHRCVLKAAGPDLILVQSLAAKKRFDDLQIRAEFMPNGVDTQRFHPVRGEEKGELREKYHLKSNLPVILHVGHLEEARNLEKLTPLLDEGMQVVIVGSVYMGVNQVLINKLERKGFKIIQGYLPEVDELYKLADCYVFPVEPGNSLSMPLSVLEAMACNLCVIATRFTGLETAFAEGGGLVFIKQTDDILPVVRKILELNPIPTTREKVAAFSWSGITDRLLGSYRECLGSGLSNSPRLR